MTLSIESLATLHSSYSSTFSSFILPPQVPAKFIKARSWSLGPLTILKPVMMTMDLEGLVRGAPGNVIGIVGYGENCSCFKYAIDLVHGN